MRPEYDEELIRQGVRGKYAKRYAAATNVVRIAPDVAPYFPNAQAVNEALRGVLNRRQDAGNVGVGNASDRDDENTAS